MKILTTTLLMASFSVSANYSSSPIYIAKERCTGTYIHSYIPREEGYEPSNATEGWISNWSSTKKNELERIIYLPSYVSRSEFGKLFCGE